jgi:serine/threonine protein kinase
MSRWYRSPEIVLTSANYGQEIDIFAMGLILVEMIYCSTTYHCDGFNPKNRYMFKGNACFPISPNENDGLTKDDQLVKLMEKLQIDRKQDFSFLSNENEKDYSIEAHELSQKKKSKKLTEIFSKTDKNIVKILTEMLEFNPNFRPTAE